MSNAVQTRLVVTIDEARTYLRVDHTDEDELIEQLVDAAKSSADAYLNNQFEDSEGNPKPIPMAIKAWVLKRAANLFENRLEGAKVDEMAGLGSVDYGRRAEDLNTTADYSLIKPFRLNPGL
jgi:hypothetical protein